MTENNLTNVKELDLNQYVDVKKAVEITGFSQSTLDKLRCHGGGPLFIKRGRSVRYNVGDLISWLNSLKLSSTRSY